VRIGGRPPSQYRAPSHLPSPVGLLEAFGKNPVGMIDDGLPESNPPAPPIPREAHG
jgi:hypothetical protein